MSRRGAASSPRGVPIFHPYLGEHRVANQNRRMSAEERKPSAGKADGRRVSSAKGRTFSRAFLHVWVLEPHSPSMNL